MNRGHSLRLGRIDTDMGYVEDAKCLPIDLCGSC